VRGLLQGRLAGALFAPITLVTPIVPGLASLPSRAVPSIVLTEMHATRCRHGLAGLTALRLVGAAPEGSQGGSGV